MPEKINQTVDVAPVDGSEYVSRGFGTRAPEIEILLCCGGPGIQRMHGRRLAEISVSDLDWEMVGRTALRHRLAPILYWNLSQLDSCSAPVWFVDGLRDSFMRNVSRSLRMTGELLTILKHMESRGVLAVPYKGTVLASRLYGNLSLRPCGDIDILVRRDALDRAREVLMDLDYAPSVLLQAPNHAFQVDSRYSERFDRPDSIVELHWAFTNKDVAFPLTLDELEPRLDEHRLSGKVLKVFSREDTLLILCVHGAKHGWGRLEWICAIAELIAQGQESLDWRELLKRANATRSRRRLLLGLHLAREYYGVPIPERIHESIEEEEHISALARIVSEELFAGDQSSEGIQTFGSLAHDLFHFRLGDRRQERLKYLLYRMTTPSRPERWSTITVGKRSIRIHSITRPFGILLKLIPASWKRLNSRWKA